MNFSISGDAGFGSSVILAVLIIVAIMFVGAVVGGLWRTRSGAPTIDPEDDVGR